MKATQKRLGDTKVTGRVREPLTKPAGWLWWAAVSVGGDDEHTNAAAGLLRGQSK